MPVNNTTPSTTLMFNIFQVDSTLSLGNLVRTGLLPGQEDGLESHHPILLGVHGVLVYHRRVMFVSQIDSSLTNHKHDESVCCVILINV